MSIRSLSVAFAVIASPLLKAQAVTETLPHGVLNSPGTDRRGAPYPFDQGDFRYQEVHSSWTGNGARTLNGVAFRRAAQAATNSTAVARTADIQMIVGYGHRATFSGGNSTFRSNYINIPSVVRPSVTINFPDWRNKPTTSTAPFDLRIPFAFPFQYAGSGDFVWEINHRNSSVAGATQFLTDRQEPSVTKTLGMAYGIGCTANGRTSPFRNVTQFVNFGPLGMPQSMRIVAQSLNGPGRQNTYLSLGTQKLNQPYPGWCAPLYVDPLVTLRIGYSQSNGAIARYVEVNHSPSLIGLTLHTQAFAADPGSPGGLALSNGNTLTMPADPRGTPLTWKYVYQMAGATRMSPVYTTGSVITGWY